MRRAAVAVCLAAACLPGAQAQPQPSDSRVWDFEARLDGRPIGTHRFSVGGLSTGREVESRASFDVRLLGIAVYRYRHEARERWEGDCLRELHSRTDDDGTPLQVDQQRPASAECLMGFAYWHPRLHEQTRLLNPQTGQVEAVRFERLPDASVAVQGRDVEATPWRLRTPTQDLTVWRARADGAWVGLDARVKGNRQLTYRLR